DPDRTDDPRHGRVPRVRPDLPADPGRSRAQDRGDRDARLPDRLQLLRHGAGVGDGLHHSVDGPGLQHLLRQEAARHAGLDVKRRGGAGEFLRFALPPGGLVWPPGPLSLMYTASLKNDAALSRLPPPILFTTTLDNYAKLLDSTPFVQYLWNTLFVATATTA